MFFLLFNSHDITVIDNNPQISIYKSLFTDTFLIGDVCDIGHHHRMSGLKFKYSVSCFPALMAVMGRH